MCFMGTVAFDLWALGLPFQLDRDLFEFPSPAFMAGMTHGQIQSAQREKYVMPNRIRLAELASGILAPR